jgi:arylsulfatase A-like enzyme
LKTCHDSHWLTTMTDVSNRCQEGGVLGGCSEASVRDPLSSQGTAGPRCGQAWANASNTPFRYYKHFVHEGGMSTPLVAHWPAGIPWQSRGSFVRQLGYLPDFMPTFIELADADYPSERAGESVHPMAGISLVPLLKGKIAPCMKPQFFGSMKAIEPCAMANGN